MEVHLYMYDLSNGMARVMALPLIGRHIEAIWHTSVVVYGTEYYFGQGIYRCIPGTSVFGTPMEKRLMGITSISKPEFEEFLRHLGSSGQFGVNNYHLLDKNCNHFTFEAVKYLTGQETPEFIRNLPQEIMSTAFGMTLRPLIDQMYGSKGQNPAFRISSSGSTDMHTQGFQPVTYPLEMETALEKLTISGILNEENTSNIARLKKLTNLMRSRDQVRQLLLSQSDLQMLLSFLSQLEKYDEAVSALLLNICSFSESFYCETFLDAMIEIMCLIVNGLHQNNWDPSDSRLQKILGILRSLDSSLSDLYLSLNSE